MQDEEQSFGFSRSISGLKPLTMTFDPQAGAPNQHHKDFMQSLFPPSSGGRDSDGNPHHPHMPSTTMGYPSQTAANMQFSVEVLQGFMSNSLDTSGQQVSSPQAQSTPQMLLEQQMRLNQLQQLQQLQNQIFQQQLELLSGSQNQFASLPQSQDRPRDPQQFLPTPANSTHPSPDFVSPIMLHPPGGGMGHLSAASQSAPFQYPPSMIPPTPHSAPANIVFQQNSSLSLTDDLNFSDISPLASPWLTPYGQNQPGTSNPVRGGPSVVLGSSNKRRPASSSGDETADPKPSRKRQSSNARMPAKPLTKKTTRATKSATSTPRFGAMPHHPGSEGHGVDVPDDSPSPIELPPMPPPSRLPMSASPSLGDVASGMSMSLPSTAGMSTTGMEISSTNTTPGSTIMPATPAMMMNLGRMGSSASNISAPEAHDTNKSKSKETMTRSNPTGKSRNTDTTMPVPLISPSLKPIRPAGNAQIPPPLPSATSVPPRKSSHKAAEQKRRDSLKTSFDDLRLLLPPIPLPSDEGFPDEPILPGAMPPRGPPKGHADGPNRGVSKLQLLRVGNDYIKVLKGRVERRDQEIEKLRREIARLRLVVDPALAQAGEEVDLAKDIDAGEVGIASLGRSSLNQELIPGQGEGDDADEEGGES